METQSPSPIPWSRACALALGWTVGGVVLTAILAGVVNGLDLIDGRDVVIVLFVAVPVAIGVPVAAGYAHQSWRVALAVPIFVAVAGALAFVAALIAVYSNFRAV